jgi:hypothetical protein
MALGVERRKQMKNVTIAIMLCSSVPAYADEFDTRMLEILDSYAGISAPVAAKAASCGYWSGSYWLAEIMKTEIGLGGSGDIAAKFSDLFNASLNEKTDDVWQVRCGAVYSVALERVVMLSDMR